MQACRQSFGPRDSGRCAVIMDRVVYRVAPAHRVAAILILAMSLCFLVAICWAVLTGRREMHLLEIVVSLVISLGGASFTWRAFTKSICLTHSSIEARSLTGTRVLPLNKIAGRRRRLSKGDADSPDVWHLILEPVDDRFPRLDIEEIYKFDEFFYTWFNALPDLDEMDKQRPQSSNFGLF